MSTDTKERGQAQEATRLRNTKMDDSKIALLIYPLIH